MSNFAPWTPLQAQLHRRLRQTQLLPSQGRILLAISGGQDSVCLLQLLIDLQPKWGWQLALAHGDHRWPLDSQANADHVLKIAAQVQLPCYLRQASQPLKSEAAGRIWRYQILTEIAQQQGYAYVVTAHTASDRAETLLYNLLRGSGTEGLQALSWQRPLTSTIQLVRPLLEVTRPQTAAFCQARGLAVWQDAMNQDLDYRRNRLRQVVLPYLATHFNPQAELTLAHTAEILTAEADFLQQATAALLAQAIPDLVQPAAHIPADRILAQINRSCLQAAPLALQRRAVRQFLQMTLNSAPSYRQTEKVTALITAPRRARTDPLKGSWVAQVADPWIVIWDLSSAPDTSPEQ